MPRPFVRRTAFRFGFWLGCIVLAGAAAGQQSDPDTEELVVEGRLDDSPRRRLAAELAAQGANVSVISAEEMRELGVTDMRQAIQILEPGIHFQGDGGGNRAGTDVRASFRGSTEREFVMLLDGVRIVPRTFYGFHMHIGPQYIERIEVLKDGQSLFYGSSAQTGVINLITKDFDYAENGEFILETSNSLGGSTFKEFNFGGHANADIGKHRLQVFGSQNRSSSAPLDPNEIDFPAQARTVYETNLQSIGVKYRWLLGDDQHLDVFVSRNERRRDGMGTPDTTITLDQQMRQGIAYIQWERRYDPFTSLSVRAFWNEMRGKDWDATIGSDGEVFTRHRGNLSRDYGVSLMSSFRALSGSWTSGFELHRQGGFNLGENRLTDPGHPLETSFDPFVQFRPDLARLPNTSLSFGTRYNWNDRSESAAVWQVLGRHELTPNISLRGSVGTSFAVPRSADIVDRDGQYEAVVVDAGPETSIGFDIGMEIAVGRLGGQPIVTQVGVFRREITDRVDSEDVVTGSGTTLRFFNRDDPTIIEGFEIAARLVPAANWMVSLSAAYNDATLKAETGEQLPDIPEYFYKGLVSWTSGNGRGGAQLSTVHTGAVYSRITGAGLPPALVPRGDYTLVDLSAHYVLDSQRTRRVSLRIENVFDAEYATRFGRLLDGQVFRRYGAPRNFTVSYSQSF